MTCHRICDQQRQPCPSAWLCEMGCNFNNEVVPMQSAQERASAEFWKTGRYETSLNDPYPPIDMQPDFMDAAIAWFQRWTRWIAGACFVIAAVVAYFGRAV